MDKLHVLERTCADQMICLMFPNSICDLSLEISQILHHESKF